MVLISSAPLYFGVGLRALFTSFGGISIGLVRFALVVVAGHTFIICSSSEEVAILNELTLSLESFRVETGVRKLTVGLRRGNAVFSAPFDGVVPSEVLSLLFIDLVWIELPLLFASPVPICLSGVVGISRGKAASIARLMILLLLSSTSISLDYIKNDIAYC